MYMCMWSHSNLTMKCIWTKKCNEPLCLAHTHTVSSFVLHLQIIVCLCGSHCVCIVSVCSMQTYVQWLLALLAATIGSKSNQIAHRQPNDNNHDHVWWLWWPVILSISVHLDFDHISLQTTLFFHSCPLFLSFYVCVKW